MKRLDKNKIYKFIGQATVYASMYVIAVCGIIWSFGQITVYR